MRHWKLVHDEGLGSATFCPPHTPIIDGVETGVGAGDTVAPGALGERTFVLCSKLQAVVASAAASIAREKADRFITIL